MQASRWLPGSKADSRDILALDARFVQGNVDAVAADTETGGIQSIQQAPPILSTDESTNRTVPPPPGSSPITYHGSIAERTPQRDVLIGDLSDLGKAKLPVRGKPIGVKLNATAAKLINTSQRSRQTK